MPKPSEPADLEPSLPPPRVLQERALQRDARPGPKLRKVGVGDRGGAGPGGSTEDGGWGGWGACHFDILWIYTAGKEDGAIFSMTSG